MLHDVLLQNQSLCNYVAVPLWVKIKYEYLEQFRIKPLNLPKAKGQQIMFGIPKTSLDVLKYDQGNGAPFLISRM